MRESDVDWSELRNSVLAEDSGTMLPPSIKLPSLPKALLDFRKKAQADASTEVLSQIIASDAGMSAELLKMVNASSNGLRTRVTSVKQALVMLGVRPTLLHLTTIGMKQMMKSSSSKLIHFQKFWNTNLERSLFAKRVAKLLGADADLAYTACMLQDFILPVITNQLTDKYLDFLGNRKDYESLCEFEKKELGWDHSQAAAQIMYAWEFPDELICCVYFHHFGLTLLKHDALKNSAAAAVAVASLLPEAMMQVTDGIEQLKTLQKSWDDFKLMRIATEVSEEFQEISNNARNHFSLLRTLKNAKICETV